MNTLTKKDAMNVIETSIADWNDVADRQKDMVRILMKNLFNIMGDNINFEENRSLIELNLTVAKTVVTELSKIIGVQPMESLVGLGYTIGYMNSETNNGTSSAVLSLALISTPVECATIQLTSLTNVTNEIAFNPLKSDTLSEHIIKVADGISTEILKSVLEVITKLSTPSFSILKAKDFVASENGFCNYMFEINIACSNIAFTTRRGAGNTMIVGSKFLEYLKRDKYFKPSPDLQYIEKFKNSELTYAGTYSSINVYCSDIHPDKILIGYAGNSAFEASYCDVGYVIMPYIPVLIGDLNTYGTMYGQFVQPNSPVLTNDCGKGFYRMIDVQFPEENLPEENTH